LFDPEFSIRRDGVTLDTPIVYPLFFLKWRSFTDARGEVHDLFRAILNDLDHFRVRDTEKLFGLGLEPLTTGELAKYLGVQAQASNDLRTVG
jgi:hypothetical protein